ncbi:MAG: class I SAM-dependent methyltransferase [Candidatus Margulisbacteria bacterium]|nr:class I SAM-dependent methyltransferase [Candidatus Margulisiibacteriota bacterium]
MESSQLQSSWRDPNGFVFRQNGVIYRQINKSYAADYRLFLSSGLYNELTEHGLLISHESAKVAPVTPDSSYQVIKPEQIPFISYPYEWCFSQLKSAALTTLKIEQSALKHGLTLKDASAYNIQFFRGRPILIDTLSFEQYHEDQPWTAYRQFCQHFLGPLALMSYRDVRLGKLLQVFIDGLPLDLAHKLLPVRAYARLSFLLHIKLHAKAQEKYSGRKQLLHHRQKYSRLARFGLVDNLCSAIDSLKWRPPKTTWGNYYAEHNYSAVAMRAKKNLVEDFIKRVKPHSVWDLGANTGEFSRLASAAGIHTIGFDNDPAAVERAYLTAVADKDINFLPLVLDLFNPSPGLGWAHQERDSLIKRGPADLVLALALVHHLAIGNNLSFNSIASFLAMLGRWLIIEFVPKTDSQIMKMLLFRKDIFSDYNLANFEQDFRFFFTIEARSVIPDSGRILYLMRNKNI